MTAEITFNPESKAIQSHLRACYRRGIILDEHSIGVHGTSSITLELLVHTGSLPGWTLPSDPDPHLPQEGDVFFYTPNDFIFKNTRYERGPVDLAEGYGAAIEARHRLGRKLGLDIRVYDRWCEALIEESPGKTEYNEALNYLVQKGCNARKVEKAAKKYKEWRYGQGIVLTFNKNVMNHFNVTEGDDGMRIQTKKRGLSYEFIYGLGTRNNDIRDDLEHIIGMSGFNLLYEIKKRRR